MSEPTIAAGFPKSLLIFAVSRGADRQGLLDRAGIQSRELAEPDSRVKLSRYLALFEAAREACRDPALALHFGEAVRMQDISIVGLVCEAAETAADVGRQLNRYARLVIDEGPGVAMVRATPGKGGIWMEAASPVYNANPLLLEAEFTRLVCNTRSTFRDVPEFQAMRFPLAMHFTYPQPAWHGEYARVFQAPVVFDSDRNGILLDWAFPALRQPPGNRFVFGALSERADVLLRDLAQATTVRARVESLAIPILHTGDATLDEIARRVGLSRRTLSRKLSAEGVTFEKVLDGLRHRLALHYLSGKKVSVNETAYLVGFSDPSAFSRAFKRWTGATPGRFLKAEDGR